MSRVCTSSSKYAANASCNSSSVPRPLCAASSLSFFSTSGAKWTSMGFNIGKNIACDKMHEEHLRKHKKRGPLLSNMGFYQWRCLIMLATPTINIQNWRNRSAIFSKLGKVVSKDNGEYVLSASMRRVAYGRAQTTSNLHNHRHDQRPPLRL